MIALCLALLQMRMDLPGIVEVEVGIPAQRVRLVVDFVERNVILFYGKVDPRKSTSFTSLQDGLTGGPVSVDYFAGVSGHAWLPVKYDSSSLYTFGNDDVDGILGVGIRSAVWGLYRECLLSPVHLIFSEKKMPRRFLLDPKNGITAESQVGGFQFPDVSSITSLDDYYEFAGVSSSSLRLAPPSWFCAPRAKNAKAQSIKVSLLDTASKVSELAIWTRDFYYAALVIDDVQLQLYPPLELSFDDSVSAGTSTIINHVLHLRPFVGQVTVYPVKMAETAKSGAFLYTLSLIFTSTWVLMLFDQAKAQTDVLVADMLAANIAAWTVCGLLSSVSDRGTDSTPYLAFLFGNSAYSVVIVALAIMTVFSMAMIVSGPSKDRGVSSFTNYQLLTLQYGAAALVYAAGANDAYVLYTLLLIGFILWAFLVVVAFKRVDIIAPILGLPIISFTLLAWYNIAASHGITIIDTIICIIAAFLVTFFAMKYLAFSS